MILVVGAALTTRFLGSDFYEDTMKPLLAEVAAVQETMPIDPPTVRGL